MRSLRPVPESLSDVSAVGAEADSPRGRIRQMAGGQGRLELGDAFVTHIDRCLDCRACETACPSGVEYGKLVELARAQIEQNYRRPLVFASRARFCLSAAAAVSAANRRGGAALRFYQRSGLQALARAPGFCGCWDCRSAKLLPRIDSEFFFSRAGQDISRARRAPRARGVFCRMRGAGSLPS